MIYLLVNKNCQFNMAVITTLQLSVNLLSFLNVEYKYLLFNKQIKKTGLQIKGKKVIK